MTDMGQHSTDAVAELAGKPYRRARVSAQLVFWLTGGSSVLYNSYHALVRDHMPWYTGLPEGFLPLAVAIGVLEYAAVWRENKFMQAASYAVTAGAMAWSALMINSVLRDGWAFGLIGDAAALSAMYFLLNGPAAEQAVARVDRKIAEMAAAAAADRLAREQSEAARRRDVDALRAELTASAEAAATQMAEARRVHQATVSVYEERVASARRELGEALGRAEALTAKLAAASAPKHRSPAPASATDKSARAADGDPTNELRAVMELRADPDLRRPRMGGELARRLGLGASTGRRLHGALVRDGALSEYAESLITPSGERSQ